MCSLILGQLVVRGLWCLGSVPKLGSSRLSVVPFRYQHPLAIRFFSATEEVRPRKEERKNYLFFFFLPSIRGFRMRKNEPKKKKIPSSVFLWRLGKFHSAPSPLRRLVVHQYKYRMARCWCAPWRQRNDTRHGAHHPELTVKPTLNHSQLRTGRRYASSFDPAMPERIARRGGLFTTTKQREMSLRSSCSVYLGLGN